MNDYVASYLLKNNFLLTALEFYQELLEEGQDLKLLKDYFENKEYKEQTNIQPTTNNSTSSDVQVIQVNTEHTKALEEQLKKKDEKISLLEYEIRLLQSDITKLKGQLRDVFVPKTTKKKSSIENNLDNEELNVESNNDHHDNTLSSSSSNNNSEIENNETNNNEEHSINTDPIKIQEKQIINYLIKDYLLKHNYKISAISFSDEVHDTDMVNLEEILSNQSDEIPLGLLYLYRYYYSSSDRSKQRMKDTQALREALSQLESKEQLVQTYEKSLNSKEKEIDSLKMKNKKLDKELKQLKESIENNNQGENNTSVNFGEVSIDTTQRQSVNLSNDAIEIGLTSPIDSGSSVTKDVSILQAKLREYQTQESNLINIIGEKLPTLIESVKSTKRQDLMPIIIATLQVHPNEDVRDKLAESLFNLIKKPDAQQREMIMNGCISLARKISPERFENELLPQCWKQIGHKYHERKILVAEACGNLAHYVKASVRPNLLLSILTQLMEDKVDEVRVAVAINLAKLVQTFVDEEDTESKAKYYQIEEMALKFLYDKSEVVEETALKDLLPSLLRWCYSFDYLFEKFAPTLLSNIENLIKKRLKSGATTSSSKITLLLKCFNNIIPYLQKFIIHTVPEDIILKYETSISKEEQLLKRIVDKYIHETNYSELENIKSNSWKGLYWLLNIGLKRLLSITVSVSNEHKSITNEIYPIFNNLCEQFGEPFISKVFENKILSLIETDSDQIIDGTLEIIKKEKDLERSSISLTKERLLPLYIIGLLPFYSKEKINDYVKSLITTVSIGERSWETSQLVFVENALAQAMSCNFEKLKSEVLTVVCKLSVNPAKPVRFGIVDILRSIMEPMDSTMIASHILPAMINLAADPEMDIKMKAISGLGSIACTLSEDSDFDKLIVQFETLLESKDRNLFKEVLIVFAKIIPKVEPYFRDHYIIKKLVHIGQQNNINSDLRERKEITLLLFDIYRALTSCILSDELLTKYVLNGLEMLGKDSDLVDDNSVRVFIKQMKEELQQLVEKHNSEEKPSTNNISLSSLIGKLNTNDLNNALNNNNGNTNSTTSATNNSLTDNSNSTTNATSTTPRNSTSSVNNSGMSTPPPSQYVGIGSDSFRSPNDGKTETGSEKLKRLFTFGLRK
ncbi:hypothetical protein ABK040_000647 [Willaertia magna]